MNKIKIFKNILTAILLILIGLVIGLMIKTTTMSNVKATTEATIIQQNNTKPVAVVRTLKQSTDDFKPDEGDVATIYSDGSWSIENDEKGIFEFQHYIMED